MLMRDQIKKILGIIAFAVVFFTAIQHLNITLSLMGQVLKLFTPLAVGCSLAFIINVLMVPMENWLTSHPHRWLTRFKRPLSLSLSLICITLVFFILIAMIVPAFEVTISDMIKNAPSFWRGIQAWFATVSADLPVDIGTLPDLEIDWKSVSAWVGKFLSVGGTTVVNATLGATSIFLGTFINLVLGLIFAIYILSQKEILNRQFRKLFYGLIPESVVDRMIEISALTQGVFSKFITGQLTEALILGGLAFVGLLILQIPHALVVSALVGATALIPVFGAFIGIAVGGFLIVMVSPIKALWFLIFIIILQQIEGNLIYPKVVGDSIGLPGIWVLAAVTIGGSALGVPGMLIGVPLTSVMYALLREHVQKRLRDKQIPNHKLMEP